MNKIQPVIKAGIAGAAGYTGGELIRLLLAHPAAEISFVHSRSQNGKLVSEVHTDLLGMTDLRFTDQLQAEADILFLCLGHGESTIFLSEHAIPDSVKIIDLSQDYRPGQPYPNDTFVYGLPEANRESIRSARKIANPGCFATAIQLALLPLAAEGLLQYAVHISGITGATGAGGKLQSSSHFPWRSNNIQVYKALCHQHLLEVAANLQTLQSELPDFHFIPMRGDFSRGIYICAYTEYKGSIDDARDLFRSYFATHPFCMLSEHPIDLKQSVNTNRCLIYIEKQGSQLIIHACIDNLLKGASGQAVQNMNLLFGMPETTGLHLKATAF